jgi:hypothetical protein
MVGLDTSHCIAFTKLLNDPEEEHHVPGVEVVAAYPGGSQALAVSRDRVAGFTDELTKTFGVTLYECAEDLVDAVDVVFLESSDARQHLAQFRKLAVGKPVFVDKPFATTSHDAAEMVRIARETATPLMSCSSLRYAAGIADVIDSGKDVLACEAFGHAPLLDDFPGLFWYGVHSAEILFALMGAGCASVRCLAHPEADVVVGEWQGGRIGVLRGTRLDQYAFGCVAHTADGVHFGQARPEPPYYSLMLQRVVSFFETGQSPIPIEETLDIVRFLEASERSRGEGGAVVTLASG